MAVAILLFPIVLVASLTAGAFISIAIPLIVFFSLQRFFVRGLLAGSVK
jgi:ABC-type glycerol-3-phosphate transport system permease component